MGENADQTAPGADEGAGWELFEQAVRGFFFEKHLPGVVADEWTDEVVAMAREQLQARRAKRTCARCAQPCIGCNPTLFKEVNGETLCVAHRQMAEAAAAKGAAR